MAAAIIKNKIAGTASIKNFIPIQAGSGSFNQLPAAGKTTKDKFLYLVRSPGNKTRLQGAFGILL